MQPGATGAICVDVVVLAACWPSLAATRRCAKTASVCWRIPPNVGILNVLRTGGEGRPAVQPNATIVCIIILLGGREANRREQGKFMELWLVALLEIYGAPRL